jgi:hypothetical protein
MSLQIKIAENVNLRDGGDSRESRKGERKRKAEKRGVRERD